MGDDHLSSVLADMKWFHSDFFHKRYLRRCDSPSVIGLERYFGLILYELRRCLMVTCGGPLFNLWGKCSLFCFWYILDHKE